MKTTNFEIFEIWKKLAKIGFKPAQEKGLYGADRFVVNSDGQDFPETYPCFDLETILDALPEEIIFGDTYCLELGKNSIRYQEPFEWKTKLFIGKEQNESLADMAARLLILLHEKGLITFGENNV